MQGTSRELQDVAMASIIKYPDILSKCLTEVDEGFFDNLSYKLIYKCVTQYYSKYLVMPSKTELALMLKENCTSEYGDLREIARTLDTILRSDLASEDYAFDKVTEFVKRVKSERAINEVLKVFDGSQVNLDQVTNTLSEAMTVNFTKTDVLNLSDITKLAEVKKEALGDVENPTIIKLFISDLNYIFTYKGIIPGTLNCICSKPGCGKTVFLINQGISTAQQGYKCLHIFLGDMTRWDGWIRYLSCMTGVIQDKLASMSLDKLAKFIQNANITGFLNNIHILSYATGALTSNQLIEEIMKMQKKHRVHYDMVIIDYDENIAYEDVDIYKAGGQLYNKMALFARMNTSAVFIASQPKTEYYSYEVLPLESLSESSKKQKILDLILTMGASAKDTSVATLYVPKNRRGVAGKIYRLQKLGATAQMKHISENEFLRIKQEEKMERQQGNGTEEFNFNNG